MLSLGFIFLYFLSVKKISGQGLYKQLEANATSLKMIQSNKAIIPVIIIRMQVNCEGGLLHWDLNDLNTALNAGIH